MRDLLAAFGFMTILPVGRELWDERAAPSSRPDGIPWYPLVGWFLGGSAVLMVWLLELAGVSLLRNATLVGALVVACWAVLTRLLHWDGLADSLDGLLGSFERERRLAIMRDSRVGAFGATAVVLVALVQVNAVGSLVAAESWWPLVAAPVIARAAVTLAAWSLPPARAEGLGLTISTERIPVGKRAVAALTVLMLAVPLAAEALYPGTGWSVWRVAVALLLADAAAIVIPRVLARPVGGVTGDLHGATVLLVETATLVAAALVL